MKKEVNEAKAGKTRPEMVKLDKTEPEKRRKGVKISEIWVIMLTIYG